MSVLKGKQAMFAYHTGIVSPGYQIASGRSVGSPGNPFPEGSIKLQYDAFRARGFDLLAELPGLFWGTINLQLPQALDLVSPDVTLEAVDWTSHLPDPRSRIAAENFSLTRCAFFHRGRYHTALIYYPLPSTKPATNAHHHDRLEVLAAEIPGLAYGDTATVICRAETFVVRPSGKDEYV
jgi:hypothetical protein